MNIHYCSTIPARRRVGRLAVRVHRCVPRCLHGAGGPVRRVLRSVRVLSWHFVTICHDIRRPGPDCDNGPHLRGYFHSVVQSGGPCATDSHTQPTRIVSRTARSDSRGSHPIVSVRCITRDTPARARRGCEGTRREAGKKVFIPFGISRPPVRLSVCRYLQHAERAPQRVATYRQVIPGKSPGNSPGKSAQRIPGWR